jgi:hypothetical protein
MSDAVDQRMRLSILASVLALATTAAGVASAEPLSRFGVGVTLGGGVEGFTNNELAATANDGAGWGARLQLGTRTPVSVEAAYDGSAQNVDAFGLDNSALLVGTAVEVGARFNAFPSHALSPYLYMGMAWRRYDLTRYEANFSDVSATDNVVEIPIGAGVAYRMFGWIIDGRVQFRAATGSDLVRDDSADNDTGIAMHRWGISGNLGYEF